MKWTEQMSAVRFAREELGFKPDEQQAAVLDTTIRRGILCCARQWGKSTIVALKAVHHAWARGGANVLVVSPSERQSGEFVKKAREFTQLLGMRVRGDGVNAVSLQFPNGSRIVGLPGPRAMVRGFSHVSLLLIDEAAEVSDEYYGTVRPFLAHSDGHLWLMGTPLGRRGFFWRAWSRPEKWFRVHAQAEGNPRYSASFLEEEREEIGERRYRQDYLCEFLDASDGWFLDDDLDAALDPRVSALWR